MRGSRTASQTLAPINKAGGKNNKSRIGHGLDDEDSVITGADTYISGDKTEKNMNEAVSSREDVLENHTEPELEPELDEEENGIFMTSPRTEINIYNSKPSKRSKQEQEPDSIIENQMSNAYPQEDGQGFNTSRYEKSS